MKRTLLTALTALLLAACGPGSASSPPAVAYPGEADAEVLNILSTGGYRLWSDSLADVPTFVLYGDGRLLTRVVDEEWEWGAVPEFVVHRLSDEAVRALLHAAQDSGLFGADQEFGHPGIMDGPTTYIRIRAAGEDHLKSVYMIGINAPMGQMEWEERERRVAANAFYERLFDPQAWLPEGSVGDPEPLAFERFLIFTQDAGAQEDWPDEEPRPSPWPGSVPQGDPIDWPLGGELRCGEITEAQIRLLQTNFEGSYPGWVHEGRFLDAAIRPLLPGETDCRSVLAARPIADHLRH